MVSRVAAETSLRESNPLKIVRPPPENRRAFPTGERG